MSQAVINEAMEAYRHAHILMEGKVGRDIAEAIPYLRTAASCWEQALRSQSHGEVLIELGDLHHRLGNFDESASAFEQALIIFRDTNAKKAAADAGLKAGLARKAQGRPDLAVAYLERSIEILKQEGHMLDVAMADMTLGSVLLDDQRPADAQARYEGALPVLERFSKRSEIAHCREMLGIAMAQGGQHDAAAAEFEAVITMKRDQLGDMRGAAKTMSRYADALRRMQRYDDALSRYQQALSLHKLRNDIALQAQTHGNIGTVLSAMKSYEKAIEQYHACIKLSQQAGEKAAVAQAHYNLAGIYLEAGKPDQAISELDTALGLCEELGSRALSGNILRALADLHESNGDATRAQAARLRRADIFGQAGDTAAQLEALQHLLDEALDAEEWEAAVTFQNRILSDCSSKLSDAEAADHRLRQGVLLSRLGDHKESIPALTQALLRSELADDQERVGRCLRHLGQAELHVGASADAHGHFQRAVTLYRSSNDLRNLATSLVGQGNALVQLGKNAEAKTTLEEAAEIREQLGDSKGTQTIRKATSGL